MSIHPNVAHPTGATPMHVLSPERWQTLGPLLDQALDLTGSDRDAWMAALRERTPADAAAVESLLSGGTPTLLATGRLVEPLAFAGHTSHAGTPLGAWTLERPLGTGGMGAVWLATRNDGRFSGHAAVKLLHPSLGEGEGAIRFRREGEVLARLTHPGIARLFDAGVTPHDQPYLVLEFVDGAPIDAWCRERDLSTNARLTLFEQVLSAVAHAHAHGVVHRDLKPHNIFVTQDGVVKLLDFGIAQLAEDVGNAESFQPFTPLYAAPEQVRGEHITTATDIYALGVLLYDLLSGTHPTPAATPDRAALTLAITTHLPKPLPSTVPRDVDAIVRCALQKVPADRYATVAAMADDLQRYRSREPVTARAGGWWYRTGRFTQRHRAGATAAAIAVLALAAATVVSTRQALIARQERDAAQAAQRRAAVMSEVMTSALSMPARLDAKSRIAAQVLRVRTLLGTLLNDSPADQARVAIDVGRRFEASNLIDEADSLYVVAMHAGALAHDRSLTIEAECEHAVMSGIHGASLKTVHRNITELDSLPRADWHASVACYTALATAHAARLQSDSGRVAATRAFAIARSHSDTVSVLFLRALGAAAMVEGWAKRPREQQRLTEQLLYIGNQVGLGQSDFMLAETAKLASTYLAIGQLQRADDVLRTALSAPGNQERWRDASSHLLQTRALVSAALGDTASALMWFGRTRTVSEPGSLELARNHLLTAQLMGFSGNATPARAQVDSALVLMTQRTNEAIDGALVQARAAVAVGEQQPVEAVRLLDSLLRARGFPDATVRLSNRGDVTRTLTVLLQRLGRHAEAAALGQYLVDGTAKNDSILKTNLATSSYFVGANLLTLAHARAALGDTARARDYVVRGIRALAGGLPPRHRFTLAAERYRDSLGITALRSPAEPPRSSTSLR